MDNLKINETIREGVLYPNGGVNKGDLVAPLKGIIENEGNITAIQEELANFDANVLTVISENPIEVGGTVTMDPALAVNQAVTLDQMNNAFASYSPTITENNLSFSNVGTANATQAKHGLLPKLSGNSSQYLNGEGNFATPSGVVNSYTSQAFTNETSVVVTHNFGVYPIVQVVVGGVVTAPTSITHNSVNQVTVAFGAPTTGTVVVSVGSPQPNAVLDVSANYTVTSADYFICVTTAGKVITLPDPATLVGRQFIIINESNGGIFVNSAYLISGSASQGLGAGEALSVLAKATTYKYF